MTKPASRGMFLSAFMVCLLLPSPGFLYAADTTVKGTTSNSTAASLEVTNSSDTSLLYVRNDGNVGIGTASPNYKLHIYGSGAQLLTIESTNNNPYLVLRPGAGAYDPIIQFLNTAGTQQASIDGNSNGILYLDALSQHSFRINGIDKVRIDANGNVGIGTSAPASRFHIPIAPSASANYGLVSLGSGAWDGATSGFFAGSASGTVLAANAASGFAGSLIDLQIAGSSRLKMNGTTLTIGNTGNTAANLLASTGDNGIAGTIGNGSVTLGMRAITFSDTGTISTVGNGSNSALTLSTANNTAASIDLKPGNGSNGGVNIYAAPSAAAARSLVQIGPSAAAFDGATAGFFSGSASGTQLAVNAASGFAGNLVDYQVAGSSKLVVAGSGNVGVGATSFPTGGGTPVLAFANATNNPTGIPANQAGLLNKSGELYAYDSSGNVTLLSPHNFSLIPEGPSEPMAWSYYSENRQLGKRISVDMLKLARLVEKITGEKLVYIDEYQDESNNKTENRATPGFHRSPMDEV